MQGDELYYIYEVALRKINARMAQLVEHLLAKERVAGSSPVSRSSVKVIGLRLVTFFAT